MQFDDQVAHQLSWQQVSVPIRLDQLSLGRPLAIPGGRTLLMYELYLTNFSGGTIDLRRIEVLDADEPAGKPLAAFEGEQTFLA